MINVKTDKEIAIMAENGKLLAKILKKVVSQAKPGLTAKELDGLAKSLILQSKAKSAFEGHLGFPATLCVSFNEEIVHAIPAERELKNGDIVSLDLGLEKDGFNSDMSITIGIGKITTEAKSLIETTKKCLELGIKQAKAGNTFNDIGKAIQKYAEDRGYGVVRELCGHGIGRELHEDPRILNYDAEENNMEIKQGMVFCLEPMITMDIKDWRIKKGPDGSSYIPLNSSLSAHFEHTIAITRNGPKILTK